jgi:hypothetical protein
MKKIILIKVLFFVFITLKAQISITADSMIICKSNDGQERFITVNRLAESLSLEIDKDLLTLRVFGKAHEHAVIENAYIIELLEVDANKEKWQFQGSDKNCIACTITLDLNKKRISFIRAGKEPVDNKSLTMIYYPFIDIQINKEAIDKHLKEKGNYKN